MKKLETWQDIKKRSNEYREYNDCTVKALAVATGEKYDVCHYALAKCGRKRRRGAHMLQMMRAASLLGFMMKPDDKRLHSIRKKKGSGITGKTAGDWLPKSKRFILEYSGHVAGVRNANVIDWTDDRCHRVFRIWTVSKA